MESTRQVPFSGDSILTSPTEKRKKESLLITKVEIYTKEIFDKISEIYTLMEQEGKEAVKIHQLTLEFVNKVNTLLSSEQERPFQIENNSSKTNSKIVKILLHDNYQAIKKICYQSPQISCSSDILRNTWSSKDLQALKKYSKKFISSLNPFFKEKSLPTLALKDKETKFEKLINQFTEKKNYKTLLCKFPKQEEQKQWDKIKKTVENYCKEILIDFNQVGFSYEKNPQLRMEYMLEHLRARETLKKEKKIGITKEERHLQLDQNELRILEAYETRILQFAKALKIRTEELPGKEHPYISKLKDIFKAGLKSDYTEELCYVFCSAISDFIKTHYMEGYLEQHIVVKIQTILATWKKNGNNNPLDYESLEKSHWERLIHSVTINLEEMKRALLGACIYIIDEFKKVLLAPPEKTNSNEDFSQQVERINQYLPKTEELISLAIGDVSGTLLTNFREIGYQLLQQQAPESCVKKPSVLSMNEQLFKAFLPAMQKIERKEPLAPEEESLLLYVENQLKEKNAEVINKHGLKNIAKLLFWFHRILNQSFMIGTLTTLKSVLAYLYPHDKNGITSLKETDTASLFVELAEGGKIALEWQITYNLYSNHWLFTQALRIELPSMDSNDIKGKVTQEFTLKPAEKKESSFEDINEIPLIQKILNIRHVLQAMKFPADSFTMQTD